MKNKLIWILSMMFLLLSVSGFALTENLLYTNDFNYTTQAEAETDGWVFGGSNGGKYFTFSGSEMEIGSTGGNSGGDDAFGSFNLVSKVGQEIDNNTLIKARLKFDLTLSGSSFVSSRVSTTSDGANMPLYNYLNYAVEGQPYLYNAVYNNSGFIVYNAVDNYDDKYIIFTYEFYKNNSKDYVKVYVNETLKIDKQYDSTRNGFDYLYYAIGGAPADIVVDWVKVYNFTDSSSITNFTITSNINTFNATINGTLQLGTTTGVIDTGILNNATSLFDITISPDEYNTVTYSNYNISTNLERNFYYFDIHSNLDIFNATINGTVSLNTTNGTINTFLLNDSTQLFDIELIADEYYSKIFYNYNTSTDINYSFPYFNVTAQDYFANNSINDFDVMIDYSEYGQLNKNSSEALAYEGALIRDKTWQEFTAESSYLNYLTLSLKKVGTATGTFPISLIDYTTNTTIKTVNFNHSNLTTDFVDYNIIFNEPLNYGSKYWLKISSGVSSPNYVYVETATGNFSNIMYNRILIPVTNENWYYKIIGGQQTYNTTVGNIPVFINQSTVNISVFSDGYLIFNNATHNTSYNLTARLRNYTSNITFIDSNTSLPINNSNITIYYPSGYSVVKTTNANGLIYFDAYYNGSNELGTYNFEFPTTLGYISPLNYTQNINYTSVPYNNTYEVNQAFINISIKDIQTGLPITSLAVVTITGLGQFNTTTGNIIIRNTSIAPNTYSMSTFVSGYDLNLVSFSYTALAEKKLTINMANETGENIGDWIVTVLDPFYNTIINADTRLLEYDSVNDSYVEIDSCLTNANGRCVYSVEVGVKIYLVTASKQVNGDTYTAESSINGEIIYFDQDEVNIFLDIATDYYIDDELDLHIGYTNSTLVNATGGDYLPYISYLSADFQDYNNNTHTICLDYYYLNGLIKTHANSKCSPTPSQSGVVNVVGGAILNRNYTYIAEISVVQDTGNKKIIYTFRYDKTGGLGDTYSLYIKYMIILGVLVLLGVSLYLRNIFIFPIGMIALTIVMTIILPSYFDMKIFSVLLFLEIVLIYLSRKQEGSQIV